VDVNKEVLAKTWARNQFWCYLWRLALRIGSHHIFLHLFKYFGSYAQWRSRVGGGQKWWHAPRAMALGAHQHIFLQSFINAF